MNKQPAIAWAAATAAGARARVGGTSSALRRRVLAAKRADGVPGLHMALQDGHVDAIKTYGALLENLDLTAIECQALLDFIRSTKTPSSKSCEAIEAFD